MLLIFCRSSVFVTRKVNVLIFCLAFIFSALPYAVQAQQNLMIKAEVNADGCRIGFTMRAEKGHVFFRRDVIVCGGSTAQNPDAWLSAPQNGNRRFSRKCVSKFGDLWDHCNDGTKFRTDASEESEGEQSGTYSSVFRDGIIAFTVETVSSSTIRLIDGRTVSGKNNKWLLSITVEYGGSNCRVSNYAMNAFGNVTTNRQTKQVSCAVRRY